MSERCPGRGRDIASFPGISRKFVGMVCRQCLGCFPSTLGMQADFQPNEGSKVYRLCQGHRHIPKHTGQFLGHGVQVMSGIHPGQCAGHVQDASEPWQRQSLIFRPCPGRVLARVGTEPIFRQFRAVFGHDLPAMFGTPPGQDAFGRDNDVTRFSGTSGKFLGTVCKPRPGRVLVAVGTQLDFQAFVGNFWDSICSPCSGLVWAAAMSGTRLGRDRDAAWFSGISRQFLGHSV
ncbi:Hypothetical predicted protein [Olea europaea subsp. europaea]|uniref:Uncharacterized protein n=1 Tax=Olea europaea subsp. europaea TaxID=158383 RepID=A0A8S0UZ52_OLEEU|nr:Hypothetical predicted protein [Olea europaea subsp. europaea]